MSRLSTLACVAGLILSPWASAQLSPKVASSLQAANLPSSAISVAVLPLDGPASAAQWHLADEARNPASTMKLLTTWAGLQRLGPNWQWQTDLLATQAPVKGVLNSPLYLRGRGDPKITLERMWLLVRELRAAGVDDIAGPLVLDASYFQRSPQRSEYDDDGDTERAFLVEPDALISNFRTLRINFDSTGERVQLRVDPPLNQVRVSNQLAIGSGGNCAEWAKRVQQRMGEVSGSEFLVQYVGEMPPGCQAERYVPVLNPQSYTQALFWHLWYLNGGKGSGKTEFAATPAGAQRLASSRSPDLVSTVRDINKFSNNLMARQLYLTIGAESNVAGNYTDDKAATAIRDTLQQAGLRWPELVLENGSGLSRSERISARHLAELLREAARGPYAAEFISSLPLVGLDGTMKKRLGELAGQAHIKTGSLRDVRAVAGYVRDRQGRNWAVVGIVNHPEAAKAGPALDQLIREVWQAK
ncbi:D-alanyl-D-alanine carboxypeptidase/D-alanyl-D-alanine-endopeptidase [Chitinibacter tainanensis]|uniref:D-alanyl-D-alanine carboxypeptidase/D-alanyl-D-alanine endopeptidase n=1 Tax=Chitinibacter tainanensis TaxID=230667 RepID=UPI00235368BB|nr:D-alanyl-D-alanine carboxypeptidase/D-alanyl-D-alanine-endopeptidase [Chitinibacter tainanensis]